MKARLGWLALLALVTLLPVAPVSASPDIRSVPPTSLINHDFPDPDVLRVDGTYYAYSTSSFLGRVPYATAPGPFGPWTAQGDALPQKPPWAGDSGFWSPDVSRRSDGQFLMYFTGPSTATGRMCVGAALAGGPTGPFEPTSTKPLVCNPVEGGDIDPSSYVEPTGARYLLYKNDGNAVGQPSIIWLQPTAADGVTFTGGRVELLRNNQPEDEGVIEAPVLVKRPAQYVLFFSAGVYSTGNYHTSYAVSGSLTGPYTRAYRPLMTTATLDGAVDGPGGADVLDGVIYFHGHLSGGTRGMYGAILGWANDYPVARGSRVRYEAEDGTLNRAVVRTGAVGASEGAVVGGIDDPDSWVDNSVFAPVAGNYTVHIGYAAGYGDAMHTLTVNGAAPQVVTYPDRGWDNWAQVSAEVGLLAGFNTIRLQHHTRWAEVDYLEVA